MIFNDAFNSHATLGGLGGLSVTSYFALSASTSAVEFIFQSPITANITALGFKQGAVSGSDGSVYRISLQGVSSSYLPDGTILGATSNGYYDYTIAAANNGTWRKVTLNESVSVSRGEWYSMVIQFQSGTIGSSSCSFASNMSMTSGTGNAGLAPYSIRNTAGSRSKQTSSPPYFACYHDGQYGVFGNPIANATSTSYNASTAGYDEYGIAFIIPKNLSKRLYLKGAIAHIDLPASSTNIDYKIYDSNLTLLETQTITNSLEPSADTFWYKILFHNSVLIVPGSKYFFTIFNNHTSSNIILRGGEVNEATDFNAWAYPDIYCCECKRLDGGAFTETTTRRPLISLLVEESRLSSPTNPHMDGGFQ